MSTLNITFNGNNKKRSHKNYQYITPADSHGLLQSVWIQFTKDADTFSQVSVDIIFSYTRSLAFSHMRMLTHTNAHLLKNTYTYAD